MRTLGPLTNKVISLLLAFVLAVPTSVFAEEKSTNTPATRTQVALAISLPANVESFIKDHEGVVSMTIIIIACMGAGWLQTKSFKDMEIMDYTKKLNSAQTKIKSLEKQLSDKVMENATINKGKEMAEGSLATINKKHNMAAKNIYRNARISGLVEGEKAGFEKGKAVMLQEFDNKYKDFMARGEEIKKVTGKGERIANQYRLYSEVNKGEIKYLNEEIALLQKKMEARANIIGVQDDITKLVLKINTEMTALQTAQGAEATRLTASIEASIAKLSAVKAPNTALREGLTKFLEETARTLKGKGGVLGITAAAVVGASLMFIASNSKASANISNSRLAVARIIDATYKKSPELLLVTIQELKKKYGDAVVVDVVYENQAEYLPLLKMQKAVLNNAEIRNSAKKIAKYMSSSTERNKAILLGSFAG